MKALRLLFFLIIVLTFISCQDKKQDIKVSIFKTARYKNLNPQKKLLFLDSINLLYNTKANDTSFRSFLFNLSTEYYFLNEYKKSLKVSQKVNLLAKEANDSLAIAKSYSYIGDSYEVNKKDSAFYFYQRAKNIYVKLNNDELMGKMLFNKAYLLFFEGNFIESEIELSLALQHLKESSNHQLKYSALNLMGCNFEKLEDYDNSLKKFNEAKVELKKLNKTDLSSSEKNNYYVTSSVNIANVYEKKQDYKKSIHELEQLITDDLKEKWPSDYAVVIGNLGYSKMKSGDLKGVEALLIEALEISKKVDNETNIIYKLNNLGEYYLEVKDTLKSLYYLNKALKLSEKTKDGDQIKTALKLLSKVDYKNGSLYKDKYIKITDSLTKVQRNNRNRFARIAYETSEIEYENKILTKENSYITIISFLLISTLILLLFLRYLKNQKKEIEQKIKMQEADEEIFNLIKEHQIELIQATELEKNRISKELHDGVMNKIYGVRLQLGILNSSDELMAKEKRLFYVDVLQEIEHEIREISHDLNIDNLYKDFDYSYLIVTLVEQQNNIGKTLFRHAIDTTIDWNAVSGLIKLNIYRIIQEALFNTIKYAEADFCDVKISKAENNELLLIIEDFGKGFNTKDSKKHGIGLKNIKERSKLIKARLIIESEIEKGTKISLYIPV